MSYLVFLIAALLPPIALFAALVYRVRDRIRVSSALRAVLYLVVIAVAYTTPWDNYLIYRGVWWYGSDRVLGTIGYVPVEEYGFMALQAVMTGLFTVLIFSRGAASEGGDGGFVHGLVLWLGVAISGAVMVAVGLDSWLYLGLITAWAGPVLAGTWWLGGQRFLRRSGSYVVAWAVPTVYLWFWDEFAIGDGIWKISDLYTVGLEFGTLPIEEAVFFLLTNVLVVQGVLLFWDWD